MVCWEEWREIQALLLQLFFLLLRCKVCFSPSLFIWGLKKRIADPLSFLSPPSSLPLSSTPLHFPGNLNVGRSIIDTQTVHLFLGQLRVAADFELVNLLKGTSTLVSEGFFGFLFVSRHSLNSLFPAEFGKNSWREGGADAIASVLKRKNPLFCSVAFRIILTLGITRSLFLSLSLSLPPSNPTSQPKQRLQLLESPLNAAIQDLMTDPDTDQRLVLAAEKVIGALHSG